jgi:hypothetical protein
MNKSHKHFIIIKLNNSVSKGTEIGLNLLHKHLGMLHDEEKKREIIWSKKNINFPVK